MCKFNVKSIKDVFSSFEGLSHIHDE